MESAESATPFVQPVNLQELPEAQTTGTSLLASNLDLVSGVKIKIEVVVGQAQMTIGELFALNTGSVVTLDQLRDAPLTIRLDDRVIAHGTLVVVDENFGVRISEILPASGAVQST